jgi:hypothetical protein
MAETNVMIVFTAPRAQDGDGVDLRRAFPGATLMDIDPFLLLDQMGPTEFARPHHYFRGLLKLHTRYGLHSCSPTIRGLYREAPPWPVTRLGRSQATEVNQQPPWVGSSPTGDLRR